ncbi:hypothetical protein D3C74_233920 [compost metagenome]
MNKVKRILLYVYLALIIFIGILKVPVIKKWGPEQLIDSYEYVPLWKLKEVHKTIDGYTPLYELDLTRIIFELFIVSLIAYVVYLIILYSRTK